METESVLHNYLKKSLRALKSWKTAKLMPWVTFPSTAPVRHVHMVENYGMIFKTKKHTIAYITDTRYFEELGSYYHGDLLMLNLTFMQPRTVPEDPTRRWTIFRSRMLSS